MKKIICTVLLLLQPFVGIAQFDLAQNIFQMVHNSLGSTLGGTSAPNIFQPFNQDLGQQIFQNVHDSLRRSSNLGSQIANSIHQQLAPLQNLGLRIHNQVSQSLMPVRAMAIKNDMKKGIGGTTIASYFGKRPRSFIIKNGFRNICNGQIQRGQCFGYLEPFDIETKQDFCYAQSYASVNNRICLSTGHINILTYNDQTICEAGDGSPTLSLTRREYRQLCGKTMPWHVVYRYYPNPNDPRAIQIPNPNRYVTCRYSEPGMCEFEGDTEGSGTVLSTSSGLHYSSNFP